jgi:hypothetical protein
MQRLLFVSGLYDDDPAKAANDALSLELLQTAWFQLVVRITNGTFQSCKLISCGGLCHLCVSDHPEAVIGPRIEMELRWHSCPREATSVLQIFF